MGPFPSLPAQSSISDEALSFLTEQDREQLTYFKWRYGLAAEGVFNDLEARRLGFQRWRLRTGRLVAQS
jgi:hypothetical protein